MLEMRVGTLEEWRVQISRATRHFGSL
jgi:hypothetical protein